ncbi:mCG52932, isoform CRA_b, partial [Mus musculus]
TRAGFDSARGGLRGAGNDSRRPSRAPAPRARCRRNGLRAEWDRGFRGAGLRGTDRLKNWLSAFLWLSDRMPLRGSRSLRNLIKAGACLVQASHQLWREERVSSTLSRNEDLPLPFTSQLIAIQSEALLGYQRACPAILLLQ